MFTKRTLGVILILSLALFYVGCSDDKIVNEPLTPDEAAIVDLIDNAGDFQHDVVSHVIPDTTALGQEFFWWREYVTSSRDVQIEFFAADTVIAYPYAVVTINSTFTGSFHVVQRDIADVFTHTTKPLVDEFTQSVRFEQLFAETNPDRGWVLRAISNVVGQSNPTTLALDRLNIQPTVSDAMWFDDTDISDLYELADKAVLEMDEQVSLVAEISGNPQRVFQHDWSISGATSLELNYVAPGTYANDMQTPTTLTTAEALRVLVIDVIAPDAITGAANYEAFMWAIPYNVDMGGA